MFRGFATISFYADDLAAATDWYTELLAVRPYYAFPDPPAPSASVEFRSATTRTSSASSTASMPPAALAPPLAVR